MATPMAMRIAANARGGADSAPTDAKSRAGGFTAALSAARTDKPADPAPAGSAPAERDEKSAASDPGVAAALAALLAGGQAPEPEPETPDDLVLEGLDAISGEQAARSPDEALAASLEAQVGEDFDAQLAAMNESAGTQEEGADRLLQMLSREMARSREPGALRTASTEARINAPDLTSGSAGTHAATQLAGMAVPASTAVATASAQLLHATVGTPRWADELGSRLVMMGTRGQNEGSLTLNPEHLGPLEVRISMNQNTANVWFGAQHADTRAALAEALPRLREMLAESGLSLGHAGVSQEAPRGQADQTQAMQPRPGSHPGMPAVDAEPLPVRRAVRGLIDLYA